jgi:hypothetical protein
MLILGPRADFTRGRKESGRNSTTESKFPAAVLSRSFD